MDRLFTRADIYRIRELYDAGHSPREIWLQPEFNHASLATVGRIAKRETFREIGLGRGERPLVSNRLIGQARRAGDAAPQAAKAASQPAPEVEAQLAILHGLAPPTADPLAGFLALRQRTAPRDPYDDPADPASGEVPLDEAELAARLTRPADPAADMLRELGSDDKTG